MTARKMRIGMSIRGHGYHPAAWRHPDVPADGTLQVEHYVRSAQTAERGKLDMIFFADGAGIRQGDKPRGLTGPDGPGHDRAGTDNVAAGAGHGHQPHRSGDDGIHHLQRALQSRPQVRHAGSDQQGPRRLERGRVMVRARSPELRAGNDARLRHALRALGRVRRCGQGPVGRLGRRRPRCSTRRAAVISTKRRCMCSITRGGSSRCAGR